MTDNQAWPEEEFNYNPPYDPQPINTFKEEINGWHSGRTEISEFQGSHTLPRASGGGNKTKKINRNKVWVINDTKQIYVQHILPCKFLQGILRIIFIFNV